MGRTAARKCAADGTLSSVDKAQSRKLVTRSKSHSTNRLITLTINYKHKTRRNCKAHYLHSMSHISTITVSPHIRPTHNSDAAPTQRNNKLFIRFIIAQVCYCYRIHPYKVYKQSYTRTNKVNPYRTII